VRILVTGGAGFIGSGYVRAILSDTSPDSRPTAVTVLDPLAYSGNRANLDPVADDPRLTFVAGDICDLGLVDDVVAGHDARWEPLTRCAVLNSPAAAPGDRPRSSR
jgi:dTDP-glucose 4,6-dehydratase